MGILHILKQFLITFATGYKKTTDMNITSSMSSNGSNKKLDGEFFLFKVKVKVIKTPVHDFLKFGIFTCFGPISGWVNESK